jgi:hypothetical protein
MLPASISEDWNLVSRPTIPIMWVLGLVEIPSTNPGTLVGFEDTFGLGDIHYTGVFSPKEPGVFIWGAGPSITVPTAADDVLVSGEWSAGPSVAVRKIRKPFLGGMLVRHLWSFAAESDRQDVYQTLIQPFLN